MQQSASPRSSIDRDSQAELEAIADRYARRRMRSDRFGPVAESERFPRLLSFIDSLGVPRAAVRLLEIGCGGGGNLRRFLEAGLSPDRLVGNELLPARVEIARSTLPSEVRILEGDASTLGLETESFEVVFASTVFTSILDHGLRRRVAESMWRLVRRGGAVLWYDFAFDNPRNPDVRGVKAAELRSLFPNGEAKIRRITLAPPIARACLRLPGGAGLVAYRLLAAIPPLRTHLIGWIEKP